MGWVVGFGIAFGLIVVYLVVQTKKAGPRQLSDADLARTTPVHRWTAEDPGEGWQELGSRTEADGLNLKFDHDDDPQAEATLVVPGVRGAPSGLSHVLTVRLRADFQEYHVHSSGYVFRIRVRGTGPVVGKEVRMLMKLTKDGEPYGGRIENDDDTDAAVGGWIEVEWAEILRARNV